MKIKGISHVAVAVPSIDLVCSQPTLGALVLWHAPQQTWLRGISTSQPFFCSTRAVARFVCGKKASAAQPVNSATRARRGPSAGSSSGSEP